MEWWLALLVILAGLVVLMTLALPVAFCFLVVSIWGLWAFYSGTTGLSYLTLSIFTSLDSFCLMPLAMFILMGAVIFNSGIAPLMMTAIDKWLGRLPGRLGLVAVAAGSVFATLTGSSLANAAMMGKVLVPEMEQRGYKKPMSLGPILGSGGLAIMIPPSDLAIFLAAVGEISIGKTLMAIIIPGLLMALLYAIYIVIRCYLQPSIAPSYDVSHIPLSEKLISTVLYVLPVGFIIFLVIGCIFLGVATPSESAALGVIGTFMLAAVYRKMTWKMTKKSLLDSLELTTMVLIIIATATAYSQVLAISGGSRGLVLFILAMPVSPVAIFILMQLVMLIMGMFMPSAAIILICIPLFIPIAGALGISTVLFAAVALLNIEMAQTTPPYGLTLFSLKAVAPPDTTMGDVYRAGLPFLGCDLIVMASMIAFPQIALWLPTIMRGGA